MHKLDKYIRKLTSDIIESPRSRYYKFNNTILRISDHIGSSSSGSYSIIIAPNGYILHCHYSGSIRIMSYEECKTFVKGIYLCAALATPVSCINWELSKTDKVAVSKPTDYQKRIYKAYQKLGKSARSTFRKQFKLGSINLGLFDQWNTKELDVICIQKWFNLHNIKL